MKTHCRWWGMDRDKRGDCGRGSGRVRFIDPGMSILAELVEGSFEVGWMALAEVASAVGTIEFGELTAFVPDSRDDLRDVAAEVTNFNASGFFCLWDCNHKWDIGVQRG
jgi:hypothetical protein